MSLFSWSCYVYCYACPSGVFHISTLHIATCYSSVISSYQRCFHIPAQVLLCRIQIQHLQASAVDTTNSLALQEYTRVRCCLFSPNMPLLTNADGTNAWGDDGSGFQCITVCPSCQVAKSADIDRSGRRTPEDLRRNMAMASATMACPFLSADSAQLPEPPHSAL